jgi:hypothetical protein
MGAFLKWLRRHNVLLVVLVSASIVLALLFGAVRKNLVDFVWLKNSKDALAGLNNIVNIAAVLIAFALSYLRFFSGRTFARRADPTLTVDMALHAGTTIHAVTLKVENIGTLTIYDPELSVEATDFLVDGRETRGKVETWVSNDIFDASNLEAVIDPGETAHFHAIRHLEPDCWASSYAAVVRDRQGNVWQCFSLVSCQRPAPAPPAAPSPPAPVPGRARGWLSTITKAAFSILPVGPKRAR